MRSDNRPQNLSTEFLLSQLKDISSSVMYAAGAQTLELVLERIAQVSKELVNARYSALGVPDGNGGLRYFKVAGMSPEEVAAMEHTPRGHGLLGVIMNERRSVRMERMQDDPRAAGFCKQHPTMISLLGVPVQVGNQLFGMLYLSDRMDGQPFSEQDQWLIETMAGYAALAIAGTQLREQENRLTLLEERERIGMELHDGVIQSLYAVGMHLDLIRMEGRSDPEQIGEAIGNLNTIIDDIRRYIMNLQNNDQRRTVYDGLRDVLGRLHLPESIKVELQAPKVPPPFTPSTFEAMCQMANEAISNAVRHAEASHINILTEQTERTFRITIEDNGKGFDMADLTDNTGLGLRNLQQRAVLHGGKVIIDSAPQKGTRVTIEIPTLTA